MFLVFSIFEVHVCIDLRFVLLQCWLGEAKCKMQQENYQLPDDLYAALTEDYSINI